MAQITSDCVQMRHLDISWPKSPRIVVKCATSTQHGPNHLGLWSNAPPRHKMAPTSSDCGSTGLRNCTRALCSTPHFMHHLTSPHASSPHASPHHPSSPIVTSWSCITSSHHLSPLKIACPPDIVTEHHFMHHLISPQLTTSPHLTSCMQVCGVLPAKR